MSDDTRVEHAELTFEWLWKAYQFQESDFAAIRSNMMEIVRSDGTTPDEKCKAARVILQTLAHLLSLIDPVADDAPTQQPVPPDEPLSLLTLKLTDTQQVTKSKA